MPTVVMERFPLPSLRTYTCISVGLLSISVYYAAQVSSDPRWRLNSTKIDTEFVQQSQNESTFTAWVNPTSGNMWDQVKRTGKHMIQEPFCVWTLVNMSYCCLLLLGTFIRKIVFGELRASEQQHIKDRFWNFIFYKFIFVFGIINVQFLHEVIFWCAWFSILGFLNILTQLGKDRFEYLSFSPTTSNWNHVRLMGLLIGVYVVSGFMILVSTVVGILAGFNTFAFMAAECIQLHIRTLHVIFKYALYLYDMREGGTNTTLNSEKRGLLTYYTELLFELTVLLLDFFHHIHMLLWSNIFLSIASLVICMQLRQLFHDIQRKIKKHRNYLWVVNHMEQNYPMATAEELSEHKDTCAICWEEMNSARKLPCTHLFHSSCLQSWLEQDTSCPTCRTVLTMQNRSDLDVVTRLELTLDNNGDNPPANRRSLNHFFHFDGSRYVSWLPSFSVEVTHTQIGAPALPTVQTSQFDAMARQVQQLFPHMPMSVVMEDLRLSRSVELTIENILDGRVIAPVHHFQRDITPPLPVTEAPQSQDMSGTLWAETPSSSESPNAECDEILTGKMFSKSSSEREKILHKKKEQMILTARRRYLEKRNKESKSCTGEET